MKKFLAGVQPYYLSWPFNTSDAINRSGDLFLKEYVLLNNIYSYYSNHDDRLLELKRIKNK